MSLPAPRVIQVDTRGAKILDEESREVRHFAFSRRNRNLTAIVCDVDKRQPRDLPAQLYRASFIHCRRCA